MDAFRRIVVILLSFFFISMLLKYKDQPGQRNQTNRECSAPNTKTKIAFMKTHKTGSTSVQNILFRLAYREEWNLVMPSVGHTLGDMVSHLNTNTISMVSWSKMMDRQGYNMLALHTKWDHEQAQLIMGEGTVYITILRDPVEQFVSAFYFYKFDKIFQTGLRGFINKYIDGGRSIPWVDKRKGRNQQLIDLGMEPHQTLDKEQVLIKIQEVEKNFNLVMILEKIDESLVLLSDLLCLKLKYVTSLKVNEMKLAKEELDDHERDILKRWLWAEYLLYDEFVRTFDRKILEFGEQKMEEKVSELKSLNLDLKDKCVLGPEDGDLKTLFKPLNPDVKGFKVSEKSECSGYGWPELQFVDIFRNVHLDRWKRWKKEEN